MLWGYDGDRLPEGLPNISPCSAEDYTNAEEMTQCETGWHGHSKFGAYTNHALASLHSMVTLWVNGPNSKAVISNT